MVTMIWLLLLFGVLVIYTVVFLVLRYCNQLSPKIVNAKEDEIVGYVEYVAPNTDVEGQGNVPPAVIVQPNLRTIFGKLTVPSPINLL